MAQRRLANLGGPLSHFQIHPEMWLWLLSGSGGALFALRVSLELAPPHPWWGVLLALLYAALCWLGWRWGVAGTPLWLMWLYVLWPSSSPALAMGTGTLALLSWVISRCKQWPRLPVVADAGTFLVALGLYLATLAPTILPADSGEFQIVGPLLGVAHPPGYALFTLLAKAFSLLPVGEVAWRVNLMGAVTGALTLVIVGRTTRRLSGSPWGGLVAAATLGFSTTFWAQSTTINIRALTVLFTALCCDRLLLFLLAPPGSKEGNRALLGLALAFGMGVAHHASLVFFAPLFLALVAWHDPDFVQQVRRWPRYVGAFLAPFLVDLYIVVRAITGAPFGTDALVDAGRVIDHLLGKGFGGDMFAFLHPDRVLWERFLVVGNILDFQFGAVLLGVALVGFLLLLPRRKPAALLGGMWAVMVFIVATYRAPQSVEYLMPAYVPIAICAGYAVTLPRSLLSLWSPAKSRFRLWTGSFTLAPQPGDESLREAPYMPGRRHTDARRKGTLHLAEAVWVAALALPILSLLGRNLPSYLLLHHDRSAREYAESVLGNAPPNAHIIANWHWYTPLRYLQLVEGWRPDVEVTYLYPQGATPMPQAWPQRIAHEMAQNVRPLIVTNYYPTYVDLPYRFDPLGEAFLVRPGPTREVPPDLIRVDADFGRKVRIIGYRLRHPEPLSPGDRLTVDLVWQPLVHLEQSYSFFVHLVRSDGLPLGQRDRRHDVAPNYEPGEVLSDRYEFPVFLTALPGDYRLIAGVYITRDDGSWERLRRRDGSDVLPLGTLTLTTAALPPVTMHPLHYAFANNAVLTGVDYDDTLPGRRRIYLHWRIGKQPMGVALYADGQRVAAASIPGGRDGGYLTVSLDAPAGATRLTVEVKDEGGEPLPRLGGWGTRRPPRVSLPRPHIRQHYLPFGGELALIGVDPGHNWQAGQPGRVSLHLLGLRPIVHDYVVSVGLHGDQVSMLPSDWVPALGAIPTFKWVRGSRVRDVHLIALPEEARGEATITVGVYDAFTTRSLPPLDEQIARLGLAAVPVGNIVVGGAPGDVSR